MVSWSEHYLLAVVRIKELSSITYLSINSCSLTRTRLGIHLGITNQLDHVTNGGTPGSSVLCELIREFHPHA